jgi:hypothetical protein
VRMFELVMIAVLTALGLRSLVHWIRRPFESLDPRDHALFALFVIGRVGVWWALAGIFAITSSIRNPDPRGGGAPLSGRAFLDEFAARFWWYPLLILGFAVMQLLSGYVLGRRAPRTPPLGRSAPDRARR